MNSSLTPELSNGFTLIDDLKLNQAISLSDELLIVHPQAEDRAHILNLKGEALLYAGHYPLASACFFESLQLAAVLQDHAVMAEAYAGLSYVYRFLEDYKAAIDYAQNARQLSPGPAVSNLAHIKALLSEGISNARLGNFEEADVILSKALGLSETLKDDFFIATSIKSSADLCLLKKDVVHAIRLYEKALPYSEKKNHFVLKTMILVRLAEALEQNGELEKALAYCTLGLEEAIKNQFAAGERSAHQVLSRLYERKSETEKAFKHLKAYFHLQASSDAARQTHKISKMELAFVKESKDKEIRLLEQVQEKHRAITASMEYARGLQASILPVSELLEDPLLDYFVFFKPKEKVGGDFYWINRTTSGFLFCVADCTGHGIPGAMLSMLCSNLVSQSFKNHSDSGLHTVLEDLNRSLHHVFGNKNNRLTANDGMDISLCAIEKNKDQQWQLSFSGANHTGIVVRDSEIVQTAYNRSGISLLTAVDYHFTQTSYPLKKGDCIYLFSDGYPDQFGGTDAASREAGGKKFKYRRLIELLQNISKKNLPDQKQVLETSLADWMEGLEQVDDICVLGIRFKGGAS